MRTILFVAALFAAPALARSDDARASADLMSTDLAVFLNPTSVADSHLTISAKLLSLATIIGSDTMSRTAPDFVRDLSKESRTHV